MQFAGHQTFYFREGWLYKGLTTVVSKPGIFSDPFATDSLGVGRNMVESLRYWLKAFLLVDETTEAVEVGDDKKKAQINAQLSTIGSLIWNQDKYLENTNSLWLLHLMIASNTDRATTWYWFFNHFPYNRFSKNTFLNSLTDYVDNSSKRSFSPASLQKDFLCVMKTYASDVNSCQSTTPEEHIACPLEGLNFVSRLNKTDEYVLNVGNRIVPTAIFLYSIYLYVAKNNLFDTDIQINDLLNDPLSPGRLFALNVEGLLENIDRAMPASNDWVTYTRTAGLNNMRISKVDEARLLKSLYS